MACILIFLQVCQAKSAEAIRCQACAEPDHLCHKSRTNGCVLFLTRAIAPSEAIKDLDVRSMLTFRFIAQEK